jgi:hypothetical protein
VRPTWVPVQVREVISGALRAQIYDGDLPAERRMVMVQDSWLRTGLTVLEMISRRRCGSCDKPARR